MIDSHCHLYYEPFVNNLKETIQECKKYNIDKLLTIGVDLKTSEKSVEIANSYDEIYCTIGIHPNSTSLSSNQDLEKLENLFKKSKKILAIGEIGLDFYRDFELEKQFFFFEKQILLAEKLKLPIVVHTREAEEDTLRFIKKFSSKNLKFIIHCFSGSKEFALESVRLGCYISFSGNITYKNASNIREACELVEIDKILIETDSPYLSPQPLRGKKNHPSNVRFVCEQIAQIKKEEVNTISKKTTENFNRIFFNE